MNRTEAELLLGLKNEQKKASAFSEIVRLYQERLYWHIRKMVLSHDDANDVLQNTFIKAWNGLDGFRGDSQISTWFYKIATNETVTFLANKRQRNHTSMDDDEKMMQQNLQSDTYFDGDEVQAQLQQAISLLPEVQRLVFNMRYFDEMKYSEVNKLLGTSEGALKASYHLAVKKITEYFNNHD